MDDEFGEFLLTPEDMLYWFPWTFHQFPAFSTPVSIHPIFGAHPSTIYYLPVIAEPDELEEPELFTGGEERILIEELYDDGAHDVSEEPQEQHYTVEEPPEVEEKADNGGKKSLESVEDKRGDICDVVLEEDRNAKLDFRK